MVLAEHAGGEAVDGATAGDGGGRAGLLRRLRRRPRKEEEQEKSAGGRGGEVRGEEKDSNVPEPHLFQCVMV